MDLPDVSCLFFPVTFVKRESAWTMDQFNNIFCSLVTGLKLKWAIFCNIIMLKLGFLGLKIFRVIRASRLRKELCSPSSVLGLNTKEEKLVIIYEGSYD